MHFTMFTKAQEKSLAYEIKWNLGDDFSRDCPKKSLSFSKVCYFWNVQPKLCEFCHFFLQNSKTCYIKYI